MAKVRIFQIAKELNLSHTDILNFLKARNIKVSSHMSPVDEATHKEIMNEFAKDKEQVDRFRKEQVRREKDELRIMQLKQQEVEKENQEKLKRVRENKENKGRQRFPRFHDEVQLTSLGNGQVLNTLTLVPPYLDFKFFEMRVIYNLFD